MQTSTESPPTLQRVTPEEVGLSPDLADRIDHGIRSGLLPGLHSLVVIRHGKLAFERYDRGSDANWGQPLGEVAHGPRTLHDLRSVTKSIVGLLYGIAVGRGVVPPPDASLLAQFARYRDLAADPRRSELTIGHALTMSLGTEWNESIPYSDPANSEIQMERAADRLRYVLDRPLVRQPGSLWVYNGGTSALIGAMIEAGTGQRLDAFARDVLFEPLGIADWQWSAGSDGVPSAASGLRLTARDLARIGHLLLDHGRVGDRQIVPEAWIELSTTVKLATTEGLDYGYQWWLGSAPVRAMDWSEQRWFAGFGNGGQRLLVMPATGLVMVAFFGNYDHPISWAFPSRIWFEIVLPGLQRI